jgi:uncharacterized protein (TIGR02271 family)
MADEEESIAIPLVEERVTTTKREVVTGRVRVPTRVEERRELVREELAREEIEVERVPIDRPLTAVPPIREAGGVTIIPIVEEVLVGEKGLVLTEEIRLHRKTLAERHEVPVALQVQRATVGREEKSGTTTNQ